MLLLVYNLGFSLLLVIYLPFIFIVSLIKFDFSLLSKLSIYGRGFNFTKKKSIVIYASSLGETKGAFGLVENLLKLHNNYDYVFITQSESSRDFIKELGTSYANVHHVYAPLDISFFVKKFLSRIRPSLIIWMESELWFNMLSFARANEIKVVLVSARMSDRSFRRWLKFKFFAKALYGLVNEIYARCYEDKIKIDTLCNNSNTRVAGDIKLFGLKDNKEKVNMPLALKIKNNELSYPHLFAFSTHSGEDIELIEAYLEIKKIILDFRLIIAPRYIDRTKFLIKYFKRRGINYSLHSQGVAFGDIHIVDQFGGLLNYFYGARVSFVGKSLLEKKQGGHDLSEALYFKNVVIFGSYMNNFKDLTKSVLKNKGGFMVNNRDEIVKIMIDLWQDRVLMSKMSDNAYNVVIDKINASEMNYMDIVGNLL